MDLCKWQSCLRTGGQALAVPGPGRQKPFSPHAPCISLAATHTSATVGMSKMHSALNLQRDLRLVSRSIFKAFQVIKMLPDNAFHFSLIGLLSNKLLVISRASALLCSCIIHLPRQSWAPQLTGRLFPGQLEEATYSHRDTRGHGERLVSLFLV